MTMRHIKTSDGCVLALHLLRRGAEGAPPVVLLHALAMDAQMWRAVSEKIITEAPVYALDCRGHGASDKPPGPYTTARFAQDVIEVIDGLGAVHAQYGPAYLLPEGGTNALALRGVAELIAELRQHTDFDAVEVAVGTSWIGPTTNWARG